MILKNLPPDTHTLSWSPSLVEVLRDLMLTDRMYQKWCQLPIQARSQKPGILDIGIPAHALGTVASLEKPKHPLCHAEAQGSHAGGCGEGWPAG